jgi:hypothetical protein
MRENHLISYSYLTLPADGTAGGTVNRMILAFVEEDELETVLKVAHARHINVNRVEKLESTLWTEVIHEFTSIGG